MRISSVTNLEIKTLMVYLAKRLKPSIPSANRNSHTTATTETGMTNGVTGVNIPKRRNRIPSFRHPGSGDAWAYSGARTWRARHKNSHHFSKVATQPQKTKRLTTDPTATGFHQVSMASSTKGSFLRQTAAFGFSLVVMCISTVRSNSLDIKAFSTTAHLQKRSLEDVDLIEVCSSVQSFEQVETAINVDLQTVEIHPEAWVFATRCKVPGKACRGFVAEDIQSICRPKKSWVQMYGRTAGDTWRPHWVAVDTACVCSIQKKRNNLPNGSRMVLTGKTFLP